MQNKRGQDIGVTTIIVVLLGVAVLVVSIIGFTKGWGTFAPWLSGNNVDTISTQCQASCATNSMYEFCNAPKNLNTDSEKLTGVTCYYLAVNQPNYGIADCPAIDCDVSFDSCGSKTSGTSQVFNSETKKLTITNCE